MISLCKFVFTTIFSSCPKFKYYVYPQNILMGSNKIIHANKYYIAESLKLSGATTWKKM